MYDVILFRGLFTNDGTRGFCDMEPFYKKMSLTTKKIKNLEKVMTSYLIFPPLLP